MSRLVTDELSPSQIGPPTTRMSAASTLGQISPGQASYCQPCSRMSGWTPVATSWSTSRTVSTATPCFRMRRMLASMRPCVLLASGERFRVQLTNTALRSL